MKRFFTISLGLAILLMSCSKKIDSDIGNMMYEIPSHTLEGKEIHDIIESVDVYIMHPMILHESSYYTYDAYYKADFKTKVRIDDYDEFKKLCDYSIRLKDSPALYAEMIINSAPHVSKMPPERVFKKKDKYDIKGMQGGMIIELNYSLPENNRTYIMENDGRNIFHEKDNDKEYYKMPDILLNKFILSSSESAKWCK